ncbi:MAG TPA: alpha/beta hydrolase [Candidatus Dormibacteraeota bacterium]
MSSRAGKFHNRHALAITYEVHGDGPMLVCHPGGPGFPGASLEDLGGIGAGRTLVILNPRGTADSERPRDSEAYEIDDYVNDLEDLRVHLGVESIDLLGHSHGGIVVIDYASRFPRRVGRLVLVTTLPRFAAEQKAAMDAEMAKRSREPWYADATAALEQEQAGDFSTDAELNDLWLREIPFYFAQFGDAERGYVEGQRGGTVNADTLRFFNREIFEKFDLRPVLGHITARTLVVVGADDFLTGEVCAREIVPAIPSCEMVTLPGGHMVFIESRDAFRDAVLNFLQK